MSQVERSLTRRKPLEPVTSTAVMLGVLAVALILGAAGPARAAIRPLRAASRTVWLCEPGQVADPCASSRTTTSVSANGTTSVSTPAASPTARRYDCFYVYPTVSTEPGNNADLTIQPAEIGAAVAQASQFSQVCNVWAPMYRQATAGALGSGAATRPGVIAIAYGSLLSAWKDYLAHYNDGRPVIFIGHSQGAAMLIRLLRSSRPFAEPAEADGVRHHPRRQRAGAGRP